MQKKDRKREAKTNKRCAREYKEEMQNTQQKRVLQKRVGGTNQTRKERQTDGQKKMQEKKLQGKNIDKTWPEKEEKCENKWRKSGEHE